MHTVFLSLHGQNTRLDINERIPFISSPPFPTSFVRDTWNSENTCSASQTDRQISWPSESAIEPLPPSRWYRRNYIGRMAPYLAGLCPSWQIASGDKCDLGNPFSSYWQNDAKELLCFSSSFHEACAERAKKVLSTPVQIGQINDGILIRTALSTKQMNLMRSPASILAAAVKPDAIHRLLTQPNAFPGGQQSTFSMKRKAPVYP